MTIKTPEKEPDTLECCHMAQLPLQSTQAIFKPKLRSMDREVLAPPQASVIVTGLKSHT